MEFKDLPFEIQLVAADTLRSLLRENNLSTKEPAEKLAQLVNSSFIKLYEG